MRKSLVWILVVFLSLSLTVVFSLAGCKEKVASTEEEALAEEVEEEVAEAETEKVTNEYTLYAWSGAEGTHISNVAKYWNNEFGSKYGFKVNVTQLGREEFFSKMITMVSSKTDTWDSFMIFNFYVGSFAKAGFITPIDKYYGDSEYFLPSYTMPLKGAQDMLKYEGSTYGFPQVVVSEGILRYRKDLIEQLLTDESWKTKYVELANDVLGKDLEPKHPDEWNWDDYLATAIFFTKKYNPEAPTDFGTVFEGKAETGVQFPAFYYQFLRSFGGDLIKDGKAVLNSPEGMKSLSFLLDLRRKYEVVPEDVHRYEAFEEFAGFQSGKIAMGIDWDWDTIHLNDQEESPIVWDKMAETVPPKGPGGRCSYVQEFGWVINNYISEEAKNDMARFLLFASSSNEGVSEALKTGLPSGTYIPELVTEENGLSKAVVDHYNWYYDKILSGENVKLVYWPLIANGEQIYSTMAKTLGRALAGEIAYDEALNIMEKEINTVLKE